MNKTINADEESRTKGSSVRTPLEIFKLERMLGKMTWQERQLFLLTIIEEADEQV